jgi:hypothetical protein
MLTDYGTLSHDFDAIPTCRKQLSPFLSVDCSLFALSFRTPPFVFNGLQPLFAKYRGGVGIPNASTGHPGGYATKIAPWNQHVTDSFLP